MTESTTCSHFIQGKPLFFEFWLPSIPGGPDT